MFRPSGAAIAGLALAARLAAAGAAPAAASTEPWSDDDPAKAYGGWWATG